VSAYRPGTAQQRAQQLPVQVLPPPLYHRQFKHPAKSERVTVPGKPGDDLARGTLNSILKQAGLK
jgi:hypothetical protein